MNILFLEQYSEIGGAQACLLDLIPAIQARGWSAHVAAPGSGPLRNRLLAMGVRVHEIPCGPYQSGAKSAVDALRFSWDLVRQARVVRRLIEQTLFDLVYVNGARLLPAAAIAARKRLPVVFHAHWRYTGAAAWMVRWGIRESDAHVIGCCRYVIQDLAGERLHVVANGVTDHDFLPRTFDSSQPFRIGIIGRIAPEKGQIEFLEAAALLVPQFPKARFVLCGGSLFGGRVYETEVRRKAAGLPVEFLGWRDDIAGVLRQLDLLVIASREEGLPRVLLEAFSAGVPVVAFPAGGIPEALEEEKTGFLVPARSAEALAARLRAILTGDPARLREVATRARDQWQRIYQVSRYQRDIMDLLAALSPASPAEIRRESPPPRISRPQSAVRENNPAGK